MKNEGLYDDLICEQSDSLESIFYWKEKASKNNNFWTENWALN